MAHRGLILDNPLSGERFVFRETATDTDGERLVFELELPPGGRVPGGHVHPAQEERFDVLNGRMRFRKGMRRVTAEAGDSVVVPAGTSHRFANVGDDTARIRVEVRPALEMERLFETAAALAREGRTFANGMPKPIELSLFMRRFDDEVRAPIAPGVVRMVTWPLAWLGRRRGLDRRYGLAGALDLRTTRPSPVRPRAAAIDRRAGSTHPSPTRPGWRLRSGE
jgi:mannose-6-phosphate isomerase-like protein (cupin superfamily)